MGCLVLFIFVANASETIQPNRSTYCPLSYIQYKLKRLVAGRIIKRSNPEFWFKRLPLFPTKNQKGFERLETQTILNKTQSLYQGQSGNHYLVSMEPARQPIMRLNLKKGRIKREVTEEIKNEEISSIQEHDKETLQLTNKIYKILNRPNTPAFKKRLDLLKKLNLNPQLEDLLRKGIHLGEKGYLKLEFSNGSKEIVLVHPKIPKMVSVIDKLGRVVLLHPLKWKTFLELQQAEGISIQVFKKTEYATRMAQRNLNYNVISNNLKIIRKQLLVSFGTTLFFPLVFPIKFAYQSYKGLSSLNKQVWYKAMAKFVWSFKLDPLHGILFITLWDSDLNPFIPILSWIMGDEYFMDVNLQKVSKEHLNLSKDSVIVVGSFIPKFKPDNNFQRRFDNFAIVGAAQTFYDSNFSDHPNSLFIKDKSFSTFIKKIISFSKEKGAIEYADLYSHADSGSTDLFGQTITSLSTKTEIKNQDAVTDLYLEAKGLNTTEFKEIKPLENVFAKNATIVFRGCNLAKDKEGTDFLKLMGLFLCDKGCTLIASTKIVVHIKDALKAGVVGNLNALKYLKNELLGPSNIDKMTTGPSTSNDLLYFNENNVKEWEKSDKYQLQEFPDYKILKIPPRSENLNLHDSGVIQRREEKIIEMIKEFVGIHEKHKNPPKDN